MSQQTVATRAEREPAWPPALTPYIVVSDARRAMDWYIEVLGAQRRGEPTSTRTARSATPSSASATRC